MFILTLISQLVILTSANPFHKYPFVFLLDVGNEELDKMNTEQIRISSPGGSLALRYPGIGYGDTIGHVRVSGIDFGTDLKADINDGGPGYNYIVLVFNGNPNVPYDAVVTIQTVKDTEYNNQDSDVVGGKHSQISSDGDDNDENTSAEDTSDDSQTTYAMKSNEELTQSSSNVYNYFHSKNVPRNHENRDSVNNNENGDDLHENNTSGDVEGEDLSNIEDNSKESKEVGEENSYRNTENEERHIHSDNLHERNTGGDVEEEDVSDIEDDSQKTEGIDEKKTYRNMENEERYREEITSDDQVLSNDYIDEKKVNPNTNVDYEESNRNELSKDTENEESYQDESSSDEKNSISSKDDEKENIAGDVNNDRTQPDQVSQDDHNIAKPSSDDYDDPAYSAEPSEIDQMFNDEEIHNDSAKDPNNSNFYDTDDRNAVMY